MKTLTIQTNPIFIKNENFQTILINVIYPYQENEKDLAKQKLLPAMLAYMTEKYPTEEDFQKALKENYILSYSTRQLTIGTTSAFNFHLEIPDKKTLKENILEEQIKLLSSDGMLIKRPLLITDNQILIGFKEKEWKKLIEEE